MNKKVTGEIAEAVVLAHLTKKGIPVAIPWGDNQRYDMIIELDGKLLKAQVKSGRVIGTNVEFNAYSTHPKTGKHTSYYGQVDVLLIYIPALDKVYFVPLDDIKTQLSVSLSLIHSKHSNRLAKDYEI